MRDMAQLRLQDEVTRLEGSLTGDTAAAVSARPAATTLLPPYVVPDGPTLCDHLNVVRLLAASSRFIVIIPIDGIQYAMYWFQFLFRSDRRFIIGRQSPSVYTALLYCGVRPSVRLTRSRQFRTEARGNFVFDGNILPLHGGTDVRGMTRGLATFLPR